jgi:amino-acid N-acetyltransferase
VPELTVVDTWIPSAPPAVRLRPAEPDDVQAIHALVTAHVATDHLLPRTVEEIVAHRHRFLVATIGSEVVGCAELAPLSPQVAEVRSLVVSGEARGTGLGRRIVEELIARAAAEGFVRLCAFTHQVGYFVHLGFSIVPHLWVREKVFTDCVGCPLFRSCGQQALMLTLDRSTRDTTAAMGAVA